MSSEPEPRADNLPIISAMATIIPPTHPVIPPEKDKLHRSELSDLYKLQKKQREEAQRTQDEIWKYQRLERQARGLESAYIGRNDLIKIIEYMLANKSTITKAFEQHEVNEALGKDWAKRTKTYSVDKGELNSALDALANNANLIVMRQYKVLDDKDIEGADSYSAALTKLKKQLVIANRFQDKDNELINKDIIIAAKETKIVELKQELVRNKSKDWEPQAVALYQAGVTIAQIALRLGISRGTIYKHFKIQCIKDQLLRRPIKA